MVNITNIWSVGWQEGASHRWEGSLSEWLWWDKPPKGDFFDY